MSLLTESQISQIDLAELKNLHSKIVLFCDESELCKKFLSAIVESNNAGHLWLGRFELFFHLITSDNAHLIPILRVPQIRVYQNGAVIGKVEGFCGYEEINILLEKLNE